MPSIDQLVAFLKSRDLLGSQSPWTAFNPQEHDRVQVAWEILFPRRRPDRGFEGGQLQNDPWHPELPGEVMGDLEEALSTGPPSEARIREMAAAQDWDRCAWYQPIHTYGAAWGIFIKETCILSRVVDIARFLRPAPPLTSPLVLALLRAATYSYFLHEHYHHKVESLSFRLEVVDRRAVYLPYQQNAYVPVLGTDQLLEEALANADSLHRLRDDPYGAWIGAQVVDATRDYLAATFPHDPPGYRIARNFLTAVAFEQGENLLHSIVHEGTLTPAQPSNEWLIATRLIQSLLRVNDHIWAVVTPGGQSILPARQPWP